MKKVVSIVVVALFVAAAAQANTVRPGAKKSTQKIDAAVANGLLTAIYQAKKDQHQEVLYADNNTSNRGQQVSQHELNQRAGAFLESCDRGGRVAPKRQPKAKQAAPVKTPEQIRAEKAAKQKEAERKKREREAFWQMYYEALANISRAGK